MRLLRNLSPRSRDLGRRQGHHLRHRKQQNQEQPGLHAQKGARRREEGSRRQRGELGQQSRGNVFTVQNLSLPGGEKKSTMLKLMLTAALPADGPVPCSHDRGAHAAAVRFRARAGRAVVAVRAAPAHARPRDARLRAGVHAGLLHARRRRRGVARRHGRVAAVRRRGCVGGGGGVFCRGVARGDTDRVGLGSGVAEVAVYGARGGGVGVGVWQAVDGGACRGCGEEDRSRGTGFRSR